jgi:capsular exopolysaccharide synthesis family protein
LGLNHGGDTGGRGELLTLGDYVAVIKRRRWIVVSFAVAFAVLAAAYAVHKGTTYRATTQVEVTHIVPPSVSGSAPVGEPTAASEALFLANEAAFARSSLVLDQAAQRASAIARGITPAEFASMSSVTPSSAADILSISVSDRNPDVARKLVAVYAAAYSAAHQAQIETQYGSLVAGLRTTIQSLTKRIDAPSATAKTVHTATQELDLAVQNRAALTNFINQEMKGVTVLPSTAPPAAVKASPAKYGVAGALVGLVLGLIAAFVWDAFDTRLRSGRHIVRALEMPLLASIPTPPRAYRANADLVTLAPNEPQSEPFRMLAARIEQVCSRARVRTILVTSALDGEGKSTTAANMAVALAELGRSVVLVDGDVLRSTSAQFFGLSEGPGLLNVLTETAALSEVIAPVMFPAELRPSGSLAVVPSGACLGDPAGPMASPALGETLAALRERADYIIIDSPPLLSTSHAMLIGAQAEAVLVVARADRLTAAAAQHLKDALDAVPAPALGFVLTAADAVGEYGYGQVGYAYRERPSGSVDAYLDGVAPSDASRVNGEVTADPTPITTRLKGLRRPGAG